WRGPVEPEYKDDRAPKPQRAEPRISPHLGPQTPAEVVERVDEQLLLTLDRDTGLLVLARRVVQAPPPVVVPLLVMRLQVGLLEPVLFPASAKHPRLPSRRVTRVLSVHDHANGAPSLRGRL